MYLLALVASVFLGSKFLAITTPVAQLTIYRMLSLLMPVMGFLSLYLRRRTSRLRFNSYATFAIGTFLFWWLWALVSGLWAYDMKLWIQAVFLITLGVFSCLALYLFADEMRVWDALAKMMWLAMSGLVGLGYVEILTNHYFFADLAKLDKAGTFASQPMSRIPITTFANQNDFAIMLLAYIALCVIVIHLFKSPRLKLVVMGFIPLALYLTYRTGSRMGLIAVILYGVLYIAFHFRWDLRFSTYFWLLLAMMLALLVLIHFVPGLSGKLLSLFAYPWRGRISGDAARVNLIRNGLFFLAQTGGLGVGAGNIEAWMGQYATLPTNGIVNIHNWWFEILVGYGPLVLLVYGLTYLMLIYRLLLRRKQRSQVHQQVAISLVAFLLAFIPASMTSANNMLIEWHWVFFGLIIAYVKLIEKFETSKQILAKGSSVYEFTHPLI